MQKDIKALAEFLNRMTFLALTNDLSFKTYFIKNKELLKSLLKHFLPLPDNSSIVNVTPLNPELPSDEQRDAGKTFVLDIRAEYERKNATGGILKEIVNVEVQTTTHSHFTDRILAYSGRVYSEQLKRGDPYRKLNPVYSLVFAAENLKEFAEVKDDYRHVCNIRRTKEPQVVMSQGMCFVIVELGKFNKHLPKLESTRDEWAYMIKNSRNLKVEECRQFLEKGGEMAKALKHLWGISQDEKLREAALARDREWRDRIAEKEDAREEERIEIARKALAEGTDPKFVAKITGLPLSEVKKLIEK